MRTPQETAAAASVTVVDGGSDGRAQISSPPAAGTPLQNGSNGSGAQVQSICKANALHQVLRQEWQSLCALKITNLKSSVLGRM